MQERATAPDADYKADQPSLNKLTEPLRNTPQSITVIPQQQIQDMGATTLRDTLRYTSGISIAAGEATAQGDNLTIRGFTARNDIFLDGMRDFGSYYRDPFNWERVEVLKGPSSILFGRGSTGGVVNQSSKTPLLDTFYRGDVTLGTDLTKRFTGDVNTPLEGLANSAFRFNFMVHDADVADRDVAHNQRFGFAPSLAFGLGTDTRVNLSFFHLTENDTPDYGLPWLDLSGQPSPIASVAKVARNNFYGFKSDYLDATADIGTVKVEHDFTDSITLRNQWRYGSYHRDVRITEPQLNPPVTGTPFPANTPLSSLSVTRNQLVSKSQEQFLQDQVDVTARFRTGPVDHTLVAGVEGGTESSDPTRRTFAGVPTTSLVSPNENDAFTGTPTVSQAVRASANSMGVFFLDTLKLGEHWELLGGLRYDRFDAGFQNSVGAIDLSRLDDAYSWRAAIIYKPMPISSFYFSAGTSFNPSAEALALASNTAALAPEKNRSFEVGTKWDVLDGKMSLRGALFRLEKENAKVTDPNNSLLMILAGNYISDGFELEAIGRLTERWQLITSYTFADARIVSSPRANEVGNHLANAPENTLGFWTTYTLPWHEVTVGGGINYISRRFASTSVDTQGNLFRVIPDYYTVNLMARYPVTEDISIQANVYNLTNEYYYDQIHPNHVIPGPGRYALFSTHFRF
ncbi:MAG: TonB-dependent siderophore receptor [Alphaproteobacteria bacterium]|nr:TonB-dependent siderophore receptor [Alphaproteobacteria bacterium]